MTNTNIIVKVISFLLWALILAVPLADFLSVYARSVGLESFERFSLAYRFLMIGLSLLLMFAFQQRYRKEIIYIFLYGFFAIAANFLIVEGSDSELLFETLLLGFKFFTFFIFLWAISATLKIGAVSYDFFAQSFTILILAYAGCIAVGAVFGIELFENYTNERWGVKGIIISGNEASGFLLIALCWSLLIKGTRFFIRYYL